MTYRPNLSTTSRIVIGSITSCVAGVALLINVASTRAQSAFFMGLGDLPGGGFFSQATDISADGSVVVGLSRVGDRVNDAFRWTRETGIVGLGAVTSVNDIRVSGDGSTVVGNIGGGSSELQSSFVWKQETGTLLGPPGMHIARDVNYDGTIIVGQAPQPVSRINQAARWVDGLGTEELFGELGSTHASGISADGSTIVGANYDNNGSQALVMDAEGHIAFIDRANPTSNLRISDDGKVVVNGGSFPPWRWSRETGVLDLSNHAEWSMLRCVVVSVCFPG